MNAEGPQRGRQAETTVLVRASAPPLGRRETRALLRALMKRLEVGPCSVSVVYGDDGMLRELNGRFRGVARPTDVLSFPGDDPVHLGDIVISAETVARRARKRRGAAEREAGTLIIHGFLHLLGYDHEKDDGEMELMERTLRYEQAAGGLGLAGEGR